MTYQLSQQPTQPEQARPHIWLERLLIAAFVFSILIGLLALFALTTLRRDQPAPLLAAPLSSLRATQVQPQFALRQLAGDPAAGLAAQAMQAGYLENARAILLYETELTPASRASQLVQLGNAYLAAGDATAAAQVQQLVLPVAILGANLPSLERAQLLTQAAEGLDAAGVGDAALEAARQAVIVAAQAPELLPAQRSQVFNQLVRLAANLGDEPFRQQVNDLARNPFLTSTGVQVTSSLDTFAQLPPYDAPTAAAIAARRNAATVLADRIALTNGVDIEPERQALEQALHAEDQARSAFYAAALAGGDAAIGLQQQAGLLFDQVAWLATKLRIADGAFGLSIVPAWDQGRGDIAAALDKTLTDLRTVADQYAMSLPAPVEQALQRVANQYLQGEYVDRGLSQLPVDTLAEQIRIAQDELTRQGPAIALPVIYNAASVPPGFRIQAVSIPAP